jgi:hypothetical protein
MNAARPRLDAELIGVEQPVKIRAQQERITRVLTVQIPSGVQVRRIQRRLDGACRNTASAAVRTEKIFF